jgi:hypothetical protein
VAAIISSAEDNREEYCTVLKGKTLFSALYSTYTVTLHDFKKVLKDSTQQASRKSKGGKITAMKSQPKLRRKWSCQHQL